MNGQLHHWYVHCWEVTIVRFFFSSLCIAHILTFASERGVFVNRVQQKTPFHKSARKYCLKEGEVVFMCGLKKKILKANAQVILCRQ